MITPSWPPSLSRIKNEPHYFKTTIQPFVNNTTTISIFHRCVYWHLAWLCASAIFSASIALSSYPSPTPHPPPLPHSRSSEFNPSPFDLNLFRLRASFLLGRKYAPPRFPRRRPWIRFDVSTSTTTVKADTALVTVLVQEGIMCHRVSQDTDYE